MDTTAHYLHRELRSAPHNPMRYARRGTRPASQTRSETAISLGPPKRSEVNRNASASDSTQARPRPAGCARGPRVEEFSRDLFVTSHRAPERACRTPAGGSGTAVARGVRQGP